MWFNHGQKRTLWIASAALQRHAKLNGILLWTSGRKHFRSAVVSSFSSPCEDVSTYVSIHRWLPKKKASVNGCHRGSLSFSGLAMRHSDAKLIEAPLNLMGGSCPEIHHDFQRFVSVVLWHGYMVSVGFTRWIPFQITKYCPLKSQFWNVWRIMLNFGGPASQRWMDSETMWNL